jgi:hypothetical protein
LLRSGQADQEAGDPEGCEAHRSPEQKKQKKKEDWYSVENEATVLGGQRNE